MSGYVDSGMTALSQTVDSTIASTQKSVDAAVDVVTNPSKILADPIGSVKKVSGAIDAVMGLPEKMYTNLVETGVAVAELVAIGGGAASDLWCDILAGVTGKAVLRSATVEASSLGAAARCRSSSSSRGVFMADFQ